MSSNLAASSGPTALGSTLGLSKAWATNTEKGPGSHDHALPEWPGLGSGQWCNLMHQSSEFAGEEARPFLAGRAEELCFVRLVVCHGQSAIQLDVTLRADTGSHSQRHHSPHTSKTSFLGNSAPV